MPEVQLAAHYEQRRFAAKTEWLSINVPIADQWLAPHRVTSVTWVTFFKCLPLLPSVNGTMLTKLFFSGTVIMRKKHVLISALIFLYGSVTIGTAQNPQSSADGGRKVVRRVDPRYPEVAKKMNLGGTVKVIAVVAPDGNVKKVEPVGGSPLLVEAAQGAISQWKYAPGGESRETVELHFTP